MEFKRFLNRLVFIVGSPYGTLLLILLATLTLYPFLGSHRFVNWILDFVLLSLVASSLRIIHGRGLVYKLVWVFGLSAVLLSLFGRSMGFEPAYPFGAGLRALFMGYLIVIILNDCMHHEEVTINTIFGASCVYVLLGLTFGSIYALCEWLSPGTFSFPTVPTSAVTLVGRSGTEFNLAYFSFVALTTVGFGDIVPLTPVARSMAALEGMLGQLYLTIVIARLVGLEIANRLQKTGSRNRKSVIENSSKLSPDNKSIT